MSLHRCPGATLCPPCPHRCPRAGVGSASGLAGATHSDSGSHLAPAGAFPPSRGDPSSSIWDMRLGQGLLEWGLLGDDAACMGLGAPVPGLGHPLGCRQSLNCTRLWVVGLKARGFGAAVVEKELPGNPHRAPQSQPTHPPHTPPSGHWHLGLQEAGGRDGSLQGHHTLIPCPCARRSGWQTLPALAAVTHRCRLALLPGASAPPAPHPAPAPAPGRG